ncbi:MAG: serine/threonine protein kinase, partial [Cyanothece sp. SIO1E1]|nr:serine/threonine protein kinase [Cyanothece sp. SIO1E1]
TPPSPTAAFTQGSDPTAETDRASAPFPQPDLNRAEPELPGGQVDLTSAFYIERPPIESRCYQEILKPGALIRIKAPRQTGKTSLMARVFAHAAQVGYRTVRLNLRQAEAVVLTNLDRFLRWFCANLSHQLHLKPNLDDFWDLDLGSKVSCTTYLQGYLLASTDTPLVLGIDEVDLLFEHPKLAQDFLGLLRFWHEEANNLDVWQQFRLVVVHSTEVYIPLNLNQSPFNVGLPIKLPEFTVEQTQELAQRHGLAWKDGTEAKQLMSMVSGHPYLIRLALHRLWQEHLPLPQLLAEAPTQAGIYSDHLRRHLGILQDYPELAIALKKVVMTNTSVHLDSIPAYRLESMGLIKINGDEVLPTCQLYRLYFRDHLP